MSEIGPQGAAEIDLQTLRAGGKIALARALSQIERRAEAPETIALLDAAWGAPQGVVIGLTGPPGVGKSTLIDALIRAARSRGRSIGVIAVDPSSRRSGGALLGDRTRFSTDPDDDGVFVRSMAARDQLGGLAALAYPAATLMRAARDIVLIETVGVGQSETDVAGVADLAVFCAQPSAGDALQFMKAGVMETPDVVLVTKADLGEPARRARADAVGALSLAAGDAPPPPVLLASATTGEGVDAALDAFEAAAIRRAKDAGARRRQAQAWLMESVRERFGAFGAEAAQRALSRSKSALSTDPHGRADTPFATHRDVMDHLRSAFERGLQPG